MNVFFANRIKVAQFLGNKKGHQLQITSGWRSLDYQQKLFENAIERHGSVSEASKWVLPPQDSMHPWGLAVDINYGIGKKSGAEWLESTGYRFGLCRRYENEWWHFEPLVAPGESCPTLELYPVALSGIE
jgi:LAS superfamily LD-carboxypeptidase LdcB